jgi:hypothetical protein
MTNFEEIEVLFKRLIFDNTPGFSEEFREEVWKFVNVGEYGLALETAVGIYAEENIIPTNQAVKLMQCLSDLMSMNVELLMERLPKTGC